jgi:hypothetical protein
MDTKYTCITHKYVHMLICNVSIRISICICVYYFKYRTLYQFPTRFIRGEEFASFVMEIT